jgi:hypothetical protein
MLRFHAGCVGLAVGLTAALAQAQEEPSDLQIHGFVSQGYIKTTKNNYLGPSARPQGSFDFTEVGINFTKPVTDKLRVGLQLFAHDLGPLGNYAPQADWYYVDYRFFDWLGFRAGKTKLPWGLYNETNDVDAGRVQVLLPQSVYPVTNREYLFAQTGGELYGDVPLGGAGSLEYRVYGGTIFLNLADTSAQLRNFEVAYDAGGRLMWQTPLEGLQLGSSLQALRFDFDFTPTPEQLMAYDMAGQLPANFDGTVKAKIPYKVWVASLEYLHEHLSLAAEYTRAYAKYETNLVLPQNRAIKEGGYVMGSYQLTRWLTPGLYYSVLFPNIKTPLPAGREIHSRSYYQHDVALSFRCDLTPNWLVKLEGHYMHGTGGLTTALNESRPLDSLAKNWGVLMVKTTGYF